MSHSYNKIWIHAIWSTKMREPLIDQNAYLQMVEVSGRYQA
jgi:hypothetical protein